MAEEEKKNALDEQSLKELAALLGNVDLSDVSAETAGKTQYKEGYYLSKVCKAELTKSKSSGKTQVHLKLQAVENGYSLKDTGDDEKYEYDRIENSKGAYFDKYYALTTDAELKRFVSDMLKFEAEPNVSLLPKDAFLRPDTLEDALDVLTDEQIYVQVDVTKDKTDETKVNTWFSLVSWKRADEFQLPVD